jgi:hypothetical protein
MSVEEKLHTDMADGARARSFMDSEIWKKALQSCRDALTKECMGERNNDKAWKARYEYMALERLERRLSKFADDAELARRDLERIEMLRRMNERR